MRQPHLLADVIDRMVLTLVQQLDPPRPDHNEDHASRCDFLFDDLRKLVAQVNALVVVKDLSVSQPGGQLFMDARTASGESPRRYEMNTLLMTVPGNPGVPPQREATHASHARMLALEPPRSSAVPTGDFDVVVPFVRRLPALARSTAPIIRSRDRPPKQRSGECSSLLPSNARESQVVKSTAKTLDCPVESPGRRRRSTPSRARLKPARPL